MSRRQITLYSDKAARFAEIREEMEQELGYEPSRPEVVGLLMSGWDSKKDLP